MSASHMTRWLPLLALPLLCCSACNGKPAQPPDQPIHAGPAVQKGSTADQRQKLSITVYNQNFGLVREIRQLELGTGRVELEFSDVAENLQPETVAIKPLDQADGIEVLEQNYRYDLLSPSTLLDKYVGKGIKVYRFNEKLGRDESFNAEVLSVNDGVPVLRINGEVTYNFGGRFAFPKVPGNLIPDPTLVWLLHSRQAKQRVEVTYLTSNLNWTADYVLVINADDTKGDLTGWVTMTNRSGTDYENAQLKLVAGDVQKIKPAAYERYAQVLSAAEQAPSDARFREEGFFEYHLYTLGRPTTVRNKEQKQLSLLEARGAGIDKKLIFYGRQYWFRGRYGQVRSNQKIGVYLDLVNSKANGMGMPLPEGVVRVYKADSAGAKQFIGEDRIDHTPRDEKIRIKMGEAFDVVGKRKQVNATRISRCTYETEWEIEIRNHKDTAENVLINEPIGGDWEIIRSSHPHKKEDAKTFSFDVAVPANGKTKVTYQVRVSWC